MNGIVEEVKNVNNNKKVNVNKRIIKRAPSKQ